MATPKSTRTNSSGGAMSVDEAHKKIGKGKISRGAFYAAVNRGEVPHLRLGHRILIPRHAFERWLACHKLDAR
jgi:excisionase family DNA binding protein